MSEQQEHELDKLSRMLIRKAGLETPSERLKKNIMYSIHAKHAYHPAKGLLTRMNKIIIGVSVLCFCIGIGFLPQATGMWEVSGVLADFTGFMDQISNHIPKTFLYGVLAFGLLVSVQIAYLKNRINRI